MWQALVGLSLPHWAWLAVVGASLVAVAARAPRRAAGSRWWPHALGRLGRLLAAGIVSGGLFGLPLGFWMYAQSHSSDTQYLRGLDEAAQLAALSTLVGLLGGAAVATCSGLLALLRRRRQPVGAGPLKSRRRSLTVVAWMVPAVVMLLGALEIILANDDLLSGCSSACLAYRMTAGSRFFGAGLLLCALGAAATSASVGRDAAPRRATVCALCALVSLLVAGIALLKSYEVTTSSMGDFYRQGWLIAPLYSRIPARGGLGGARIERTRDTLGEVVTVRQPNGDVTRARLTLGPWHLDRAGQLIDHMHLRAREGGPVAH